MWSNDIKETKMNENLIKNLDNDLLLELYKEISSNLTYQRKAWLDNEKSRTEHLKSLILETRNELNLIIKLMNEKGIKI